MNRRQSIAAVLLYLTAGVLVAGAFADLTMTSVPAHELAFLGATSAAADPQVQALVLLLTRMIGCWYIAVAIGVVALAPAVYRDRQLRARLSVAGMTVLPCTLILLLTSELGFGPNVIASVVIIVLAGIGCSLPSSLAHNLVPEQTVETRP